VRDVKSRLEASLVDRVAPAEEHLAVMLDGEAGQPSGAAKGNDQRR
jgi:hypothetical protein